MNKLKFKGICILTDRDIFGYGACIIEDQEIALIIHKKGINLTQQAQVHFNSVKQLAYEKNGVEYYDGDKVMVQGRKRIGVYQDEIIKAPQGFTLKLNWTYLNADRCFIAIKSKV